MQQEIKKLLEVGCAHFTQMLADQIRARASPKLKFQKNTHKSLNATLTKQVAGPPFG